MQGLVEVMGTDNCGYSGACYFWHLKWPAAGYYYEYYRYLPSYKKREKRSQVLSATPEQDQGQDAALGQQAAPTCARVQCTGGPLSLHVARDHTRPCGSVQPLQDSSHALQFGNGLEPGFLWEQGKRTHTVLESTSVSQSFLVILNPMANFS